MMSCDVLTPRIFSGLPYGYMVSSTFNTPTLSASAIASTPWSIFIRR